MSVCSISDLDQGFHAFPISFKLPKLFRDVFSSFFSEGDQAGECSSVKNVPLCMSEPLHAPPGLKDRGQGLSPGVICTCTPLHPWTCMSARAWHVGVPFHPSSCPLIVFLILTGLQASIIRQPVHCVLPLDTQPFATLCSQVPLPGSIRVPTLVLPPPPLTVGLWRQGPWPASLWSTFRCFLTEPGICSHWCVHNRPTHVSFSLPRISLTL